MSDRRAPEARAWQEIQAAKALMGHIQRLNKDEPELIPAAFDEHTSLNELIRELVLSVDEDEIFLSGIKDRQAELSERKARLTERKSKKLGLIKEAMVAAKWKSKELDIATLSVRKTPPKVEVLDEKIIPKEYWIKQPSKLSKSAISGGLKAGEQVPGARFLEASETVAIRRK